LKIILNWSLRTCNLFFYLHGVLAVSPNLLKAYQT
jgi:hypothetical protein